MSSTERLALGVLVALGLLVRIVPVLAGPFSPSDCCIALREALATGPYEIVYDGPGATIALPASTGSAP